MFKHTCLSASLILAAIAAPAWAQTPTVIASVKPLALMQSDMGLGYQDSIVPEGVTPHDFTLRASQMKRIKEADLVIWLGPEVEPALAKIMASKAAHEQIILPAYGVAMDLQAHTHDHHEHEHEDEEHADEDVHDDQGHEGHDHADLHPWTSPKYMLQAIATVHHELEERDFHLTTNQEQQIEALEHALDEQLHEMQEEWHAQPPAYLIFHDALGPFETDMGIQAKGSLADSAGAAKGAKTLVELKHMVQAGEVNCILIDDEANLALVDKLAGDELVKVGVDILAWHQPVADNNLLSYFDALQNGLRQCR